MKSTHPLYSEMSQMVTLQAKQTNKDLSATVFQGKHQMLMLENQDEGILENDSLPLTVESIFLSAYVNSLPTAESVTSHDLYQNYLAFYEPYLVASGSNKISHEGHGDDYLSQLLRSIIKGPYKLLHHTCFGRVLPKWLPDSKYTNGLREFNTTCIKPGLEKHGCYDNVILLPSPFKITSLQNKKPHVPVVKKPAAIPMPAPKPSSYNPPHHLPPYCPPPQQYYYQNFGQNPYYHY